MASFNRVIIMGNLTRDPDVRATGANGVKVARLGLAVNERRKDRNGNLIDAPVFVDVDAWDKQAELCGQYLTKGAPILVEGRLQMDTWEKDGVKHQKLKVRALTIKFVGSKSDPRNAALASRPAEQPVTAPSPDGISDDIPF